MTTIERNDLIVKHLSHAERLASIRFRKMPRSVQWDELKSAAYMGLVDAADKYDGQGCFEAYSKWRIIGEMRDYLRSRPLWGRSKCAHIEFLEVDRDCAAEEETGDFNEFFEEITEGLSDKERRILYLYYAEDYTLKQISAEVELSQTRVHQILHKSVAFLRRKGA